MQNSQAAKVTAPSPARQEEALDPSRTGRAGGESQYLDLFRSERALIDAHSQPELNALRDEAAATFERLGFPTRKVERYRYTDVAAAFAPNYGLNLSRLRIPANPYEAFRCDVPNLSTSVYFVVNDQLYKEALPKTKLPEGVIVDSQLRSVRPDGQPSTLAPDPISALNAMLGQDGLHIYIPAGVRVERPIQVVNILRSAVPLMVNRRVQIIAEAGAEVQLLFCDHAADDQDFLATQGRVSTSSGSMPTTRTFWLHRWWTSRWAKGHAWKSTSWRRPMHAAAGSRT